MFFPLGDQGVASQRFSFTAKF